MIPEFLITIIYYCTAGGLVGTGTVFLVKRFFPEYDIFKLEYLPFYQKGKTT